MLKRKNILILILSLLLVGCGGASSNKTSIEIYDESVKNNKNVTTETLNEESEKKENINLTLRDKLCLIGNASIENDINATLEGGSTGNILVRFTDNTKDKMLQYDGNEVKNLEDVLKADKVANLPKADSCIDAQMLYKGVYKGKTNLGVERTWPIFEIVTFNVIDKIVAEMKNIERTIDVNKEYDLGNNLKFKVNKVYVSNEVVLMQIDIDNQNSITIKGLYAYSSKYIIDGAQLKNGADGLYFTGATSDFAGKSKVNQYWIFSGSDLIKKLDSNSSTKLNLEYYLDNDAYNYIKKNITIELK